MRFEKFKWAGPDGTCYSFRVFGLRFWLSRNMGFHFNEGGWFNFGYRRPLSFYVFLWPFGRFFCGPRFSRVSQDAS